MNTILTLLAVTTTIHALPPNLLTAICYTESKLTPTAIHHDDGGSDSLGLCQVKLATARWMGFKGTQQNLLLPEVNAYYAGKYLKHQLVRYNGNVTKAVIAYNIGHAGNLQSTDYSDKVLKQWRKYANKQ